MFIWYLLTTSLTWHSTLEWACECCWLAGISEIVCCLTGLSEIVCCLTWLSEIICCLTGLSEIVCYLTGLSEIDCCLTGLIEIYCCLTGLSIWFGWFDPFGPFGSSREQTWVACFTGLLIRYGCLSDPVNKFRYTCLHSDQSVLILQLPCKWQSSIQTSLSSP